MAPPATSSPSTPTTTSNKKKDKKEEESSAKAPGFCFRAFTVFVWYLGSSIIFVGLFALLAYYYENFYSKGILNPFEKK
ncbi:hypothetical protein C9374_006683 [Naegleria lovaniensis]|uniref:Uncharacterized protein n=1 Tax=Naegleria lovaniensis TaxID=51637 RepID=A0AA88GNB6_NAELO|nr:uncharacterized protein C9374_006683 [Naegleria lovaniensis]KAG2379566.1 hypothetical protein C9374_006683 [Naegleria lovaniensis]